MIEGERGGKGTHSERRGERGGKGTHSERRGERGRYRDTQ